MAKTARKRKSKQEQVSEELKLRIICLFFFFSNYCCYAINVCGDHLNYVFNVCIWEFKWELFILLVFFY